MNQILIWLGIVLAFVGAILILPAIVLPLMATPTSFNELFASLNAVVWADVVAGVIMAYMGSLMFKIGMGKDLF